MDEGFLQLFLWTFRRTFWRPSEKIHAKVRLFFDRCKKTFEKKDFWTFSAVGSTGIVGPSFVNLAEIYLNKRLCVYGSASELDNNYKLNEKISINASLTCRIKFWQTAEIFSRKRPNFFARSEIFSRSFFPRTLIKSGKLDFIEFPRLEKCWSFAREMQPSIFLTGIVNKNGSQKQAGGR